MAGGGRCRLCLVLDSCVQYGLITVDGKKHSGVNIGRCEYILEEAKKRGIVPKEDLKL